MVGRLCEIRTQNGVVAAEGTRWGAGTLVKLRAWGEMRAVPSLLSYTLAFALQLRKHDGKASVRVAAKCQLSTIQFVDRAAVTAAGTDSNLRNPWLALQVCQVNPRSAQISSELPN